MKTWSIYIVLTVDKQYYTGISTNPSRRYREHLAQNSKTARFLRAHKPHLLVMTQEVGSHGLALQVEYHFKRLTHQQKKQIIEKQKINYDLSSGKIIV